VVDVTVTMVNAAGRGFAHWLGQPGNRARFAMIVRWLIWAPVALAVGYCVVRALVAYNDDPSADVWRGWLIWAAAVGLAPTSIQFLFWLRDQARRPDVYLYVEEYQVGADETPPTSIHAERVNLVGRVIERKGEHTTESARLTGDGDVEVGFEVVVANRGTARVSDGLVNVLAPADCRWETATVEGRTSGPRVMPLANSAELNEDGVVEPVTYVAFERNFPPDHDIITRLVLRVPRARERVPVVIRLDGEPNHHRRTRIWLDISVDETGAADRANGA